VNLSIREVERLKGQEGQGRYPVKTKAPDPEFYRWLDKSTGTEHRIPVGIDPGWDYNPGKVDVEKWPV
jgi:hypothetical protein